jgi:hypothetical protein
MGVEDEPAGFSIDIIPVIGLSTTTGTRSAIRLRDTHLYSATNIRLVTDAKNQPTPSATPSLLDKLKGVRPRVITIFSSPVTRRSTGNAAR